MGGIVPAIGKEAVGRARRTAPDRPAGRGRRAAGRRLRSATRRRARAAVRTVVRTGTTGEVPERAGIAAARLGDVRTRASSRSTAEAVSDEGFGKMDTTEQRSGFRFPWTDPAPTA